MFRAGDDSGSGSGDETGGSSAEDMMRPSNKSGQIAGRDRNGDVRDFAPGPVRSRAPRAGSSMRTTPRESHFKVSRGSEFLAFAFPAPARNAALCGYGTAHTRLVTDGFGPTRTGSQETLDSRGFQRCLDKLGCTGTTSA